MCREFCRIVFEECLGSTREVAQQLLMAPINHLQKIRYRILVARNPAQRVPTPVIYSWRRRMRVRPNTKVSIVAGQDPRFAGPTEDKVTTLFNGCWDRSPAGRWFQPLFHTFSARRHGNMIVLAVVALRDPMLCHSPSFEQDSRLYLRPNDQSRFSKPARC